MDNQLVTISRPTDLQAIKDLVTNGLNSPNSKVMYAKALDDFLVWYQAKGAPGLNKATLQAYKAHLQELNYAPATINQKLTAVRRLAVEAVDNGLIDPLLLAGISRIKGMPLHGVRSGNWLTKDQAQKLIQIPDIKTLKGLRDRAILAVMLGAGLRRSEVAGLNFDHIQQRESRWVIVDLIGKGGRVRTVPIPAWTKQAIDEYTLTANIKGGQVFRSITKGGAIGQAVTDQGIQDAVKHYAKQAGLELSAHDLRRTYAKLAHRGGAEIDQIQLSLGHASIQTTERYLGVKQNFDSAPCDVIKLHLV
jgi:site-specific recombinase XerD